MDLTPKTKATKAKMNKGDSIKLKPSCTSKENIDKMRTASEARKVSKPDAARTLPVAQRFQAAGFTVLLPQGKGFTQREYAGPWAMQSIGKLPLQELPSPSVGGEWVNKQSHLLRHVSSRASHGNKPQLATGTTHPVTPPPTINHHFLHLPPSFSLPSCFLRSPPEETICTQIRICFSF